ncbi:phage holin family protein [Polaribacter sp.]|uniref:phage holin family protein n=1 Tax=Polaribacter sp. TaxID=1920175 RepID=UPI004048D2AA
MVAIVILLLNMFVKPNICFFNITCNNCNFWFIFAVINAIIILLADKLLDHFSVAGFFTALLFSILLSIFRSILFSLLKEEPSNLY